MTFPRFGPNGAFAFFSDERDVPPGWVGTEDDARRMQTLAPPVGSIAAHEVERDRQLASPISDFVFRDAPDVDESLRTVRRHRRGRK